MIMELIFKDENDVFNKIQVYSSRVSTPIIKKKKVFKNIDTHYDKFCEHLLKPPTKLKILLPRKYRPRSGYCIFNLEQVEETSLTNGNIEYQCKYSEKSTKLLGNVEISGVFKFPKEDINCNEILEVDDKNNEAKKGKCWPKWNIGSEITRNKLLKIINIFGRKQSNKKQSENIERYGNYSDVIFK